MTKIWNESGFVTDDPWVIETEETKAGSNEKAILGLDAFLAEELRAHPHLVTDLALRRDSARVRLTGWDDLAGIYAAIISSINQADSLVVQSQEARLAQGWIPSQRDAAVMTGYVNDVRAILERAQALWGLHSTRRGGTTSPDDHGEMLSLATKYFELKDLYQSTVVPLVNRLVSATPT